MNMKKKILNATFTLLLITTVTLAFAQPGGGGGGSGSGGPPPGTGAPVDGGAAFLLLGVVAYSYKCSLKPKVNED